MIDLQLPNSHIGEAWLTSELLDLFDAQGMAGGRRYVLAMYACGMRQV